MKTLSKKKMSFTYVPKSDDMWQALQDECEEIEKFFKKKSSKSS